MATTIPKAVLDNFPEEEKPKKPTIDENALLEDAIEVIKKRGWWGFGWGNGGGQEVCILESVNVARYGSRRGSLVGVPVGVVRRIHDSIFPESRRTLNKHQMAVEVMRWNDGGRAQSRGGKKEVLRVLREALKARGKK